MNRSQNQQTATTKAERRERKNKTTMKVSGGHVKKIQRLIIQRKGVDRKRSKW